MSRAYLLGPALALILLPSGVVAAALPVLRPEWQTTALGAGWAISAFQLGYALSVLVVLPLTDRLPTRRIVVACAALSSLSFLLFPVLAVGVWSAAALRFVAGLGLAGVYMPGVRVVAAAAGRRRGFAVGAYVSAFYFGTSASLWLSGFFLPTLGWRGVALVLAAMSVAAIPLVAIGSGASGAPSGQNARFDPAVLRHSQVLRNILAYSGHGWELYIFRGWLAAYMASLLAAGGLAPTLAAARGSLLAALMTAFGIVGVWLGGWLSDRGGAPPPPS